MKNFKTIVMAFASLFIYSSLHILLSYAFGENVLGLKITTGTIFIILGSLYLNVITGPFGWKPDISKKYVYLSLGSITALAVTGMFTADFIVRIIGDSNFESINYNYDNLSLQMQILTACTSIFLSPVVEEIIFRGFMYRYLSDFNKPVALILSSLIFALTHGTLVHLYIAFIGGLILACVYEKTRRLRFAIVIHMTYNLLATVLSFFSYPVFMSNIIFIVVFNVITIAVLFLLVKASVYNKSVVVLETEDMKKQREETSRIVEEVMAEIAERKKQKIRHFDEKEV